MKYVNKGPDMSAEASVLTASAVRGEGYVGGKGKTKKRQKIVNVSQQEAHETLKVRIWVVKINVGVKREIVSRITVCSGCREHMMFFSERPRWE